VVAVDRPATGSSKRTAIAALDDGREVVVQWRPTDEGGLGAEPLLARLVAERTAVPVAPVVATGTHRGRAYLVSERVEGRDLHRAIVDLAPTAATRVVRSLGRSLGLLHAAFPFAAAGRVIERDGRLAVADPADARAWLREYVERGLKRLPPGLADLEPAVARLLDEHLPGLPADTPVALFPWDLRPGNAIVRDGRLVALLDWGDPLAAPPGLSLAKTDYLTTDWYFEGGRVERLRAALHDGYRQAAPLPPDYPERRPLYRVAGIVRSAVDADGAVTRPRYPMVGPDEAVAFHRERLLALL